MSSAQQTTITGSVNVGHAPPTVRMKYIIGLTANKFIKDIIYIILWLIKMAFETDVSNYFLNKNC